MNVSLTPRLEKFVQKKVDSEQYQTASEVVREALRLLEEKDEDRTTLLKEFRQNVRAGFQQVEQGRYIDGKDLSVERIRKLAIKKFGDPTKRRRPNG